MKLIMVISVAFFHPEICHFAALSSKEVRVWFSLKLFYQRKDLNRKLVERVRRKRQIHLPNLKEEESRNEVMVKAVVIGLGAGLLPMFLHKCMPFIHIEAVELDPLVIKIAKEYFGFVEDDRLQVHIADGIQYVRKAVSFTADDQKSDVQGNEDGHCNSEPPSSNGSRLASHVEGQGISKIDIVIIDVDSADSSSGMTCPAADFVDESFLQTVKDALTVISRMKMVFSHLFCLQLEEDVNEVIFALPSASFMKEDGFAKATFQLEKLLKLEHPEISQSIINLTKKIRHLK